MSKKIVFTVSLIASTALAFAQKTTYPSGLKVGDKAPQIPVQDNHGETFDLYKQLEKGEVVMVFYRGEWCPYCNRQLMALNDSLSMIMERGAQVVAISPETMENVGKSVEKSKAEFPVISDNGMRIMRAYKVNFSLDTATITKYKGYGIDLNVANGTNGNNLPVPATYIIGKDGKVKYAFFNPDYKLRSSVADILEKL